MICELRIRILECIALRDDARRCAMRSALLPQIRASHERKFFFDPVEQPVVRFKAFLGDFLRLCDRVEMHFYVNTFPAVLAKSNEVFKRAVLLLPARIRESFGDRTLGKIKHVGETKRHEIAGETSKISHSTAQKLFHLAWDVNGVADCFHT